LRTIATENARRRGDKIGWWKWRLKVWKDIEKNKNEKDRKSMYHGAKMNMTIREYMDVEMETQKGAKCMSKLRSN